MIPNIGQFDPTRSKTPVRSGGTTAPAAGNVKDSVNAVGLPTSTSVTQRASASTVLRLAAEGAPVNQQLVQEIRTAITEGRYPLDPNKIAAAMIAVDMPQPK